MLCLVTGAAGFIGSHLCEALLRDGHDVRALDAFVPYYPRPVKERNIRDLTRHPRCRFEECDLREGNIEKFVADVEVVYHLAAMPGLVRSWVDSAGYWGCNVQATVQLLDAVQRAAPRLRRFIYASTSSVYGRYASGDESLPTRPISPYGVTKLAAEHLCRAHFETRELPLVVLRYFSVYGPRQRPDMGYHAFIRALLTGQAIGVTGDGKQARGNTYVSDAVAATIAAAKAMPGEVFNVGGGESADVWDIIARLEKITGKAARIERRPERAGDQRHTFADTRKLQRHLGWRPEVALDDGLSAQVEWQKQEPTQGDHG